MSITMFFPAKLSTQVAADADPHKTKPYRTAKDKTSITKEIICKLNDLVLDNIEKEEKGIYRLRKVHIEGASFVPPMPNLIPKLMNEFLNWLNKNKDKMNIVDFVALAHEKFVFIHPFIDGDLCYRE